MPSELFEKLDRLRAVHDKEPQQFKIIDRKLFLKRPQRNERGKPLGYETAAVVHFAEPDYRHWLALNCCGLTDWALTRELVRRAMGYKMRNCVTARETDARAEKPWRIIPSQRRDDYRCPVSIFLTTTEDGFLSEIMWRWGLSRGQVIREMVLDSMLGEPRDWFKFQWPNQYGDRYQDGKLPKGRGEL